MAVGEITVRVGNEKGAPSLGLIIVLNMLSNDAPLNEITSSMFKMPSGASSTKPIEKLDNSVWFSRR